MAVLAVAAALIVAGCAGPGSAAPPPPMGSATPTVVADPRSPIPTDATAPSPVGPPGAAMRADGGDPVPGQLGTYTWGDSGTDAPFLGGNPIAVGAGEPLIVAIPGPVKIAAWRARAVAARADPADGRLLAVGTATPTFAAPTVGRWTVELVVDFVRPVGSASYFWEVTAR